MINALKKQVLYIKFFYFLIFFGPGFLFPLLSVYLHDGVGLTSAQIGTVMSIGPIVSVLFQPVWGIVADRTQNPRLVLTLALVGSAAAGMFYSFGDTFGRMMIATVMMFIPLCALTPISDSVTVSFANANKLNYGSFRLWGAAAYACASFLAGKMAEKYGFSVIFYAYTVSLLLAALLSLSLPNDRQTEQIKLKTGLSGLFRDSKFVLFLAATFLTFGPMDANNTYLGLFLQHIGGTVAGVGLAWFLIAMAEVPFMKFAGVLTGKYGTLPIAAVAMIISGLRYILYAFSPPIEIVYASTIAQGFSFGLFVTASLQYVQEIAPKEMRHTAVAVFSAVAYGIGNWFFTLLGGIVLDSFSIFAMYLFFGIVTGAGLILFFAIHRFEKMTTRKKREGATEGIPRM
ncbi:MFS transporter [Brevibacillus sp. SYP-B805]|uniref:MFS transporter n=1 Tax=Brevibacillus sp. SYP-B805 TaxID=1578199 RepID=UPI0013E9F839|nr:MFS transporter [Brevibacillus sp. SYP-B805]NGQ95188.1 MFS transporter [Brevibacillus sp. SYP-B805]